MQRAQASLLPDGRRLHLQHGPIDLIIEVFDTGRPDSPGRDAAYQRATARFETILTELVAELPALRAPGLPGTAFTGAVARRMQAAIAPHCGQFVTPQFVTPMAAVAGAVADEVLHHICAGHEVTKAYVNNGGDIAFHLAPGEQLRAALAAVPGGRATLDAASPHRGMATSGWRGRSFSLGIADSVTVLARTAAAADVAATLIANAVDLPDCPAITRTPANTLAPDSDLGDTPVTTDVGTLTEAETRRALRRGCRVADAMLARGLIGAACLQLGDTIEDVGAAIDIRAISPSYPPHALIQEATHA